MFDPNANPETVAARAAELALEQLQRLEEFLKDPNHTGIEFYQDRFECGISNQIARYMGAYAVLKGFVPRTQLPE